MISHTRKKLDQVWKLIQEINMKICEVGQVSGLWIKYKSLSMN